MPGRHATRKRARYDAWACLPASTTGSGVWQWRARRWCGADTTTDLNGLQRDFRRGLCNAIGAGFSWPCWPILGPCWGFAAGLRCWAGRGRACNACFHCMNAQCWARIQHGMVYGIAYGLGYGIALAWPALGVWLRLAWGLACCQYIE